MTRSQSIWIDFWHSILNSDVRVIATTNKPCSIDLYRSLAATTTVATATISFIFVMNFAAKTMQTSNGNGNSYGNCMNWPSRCALSHRLAVPGVCMRVCVCATLIRNWSERAKVAKWPKTLPRLAKLSALRPNILFNRFVACFAFHILSNYPGLLLLLLLRGVCVLPTLKSKIISTALQILISYQIATMRQFHGHWLAQTG